MKGEEEKEEIFSWTWNERSKFQEAYTKDRNQYAPYATRGMKVLLEDWIEFPVCKISDLKFAPAMNV
jgi:hypothetical protein